MADQPHNDHRRGSAPPEPRVIDEIIATLRRRRSGRGDERSDEPAKSLERTLLYY